MKFEPYDWNISTGNYIDDINQAMAEQEQQKFNAQAILLESIDNATQEQAIAIEQITKGMDQISAVVQTNAVTAEESSASSEELSAQVAVLKEEISRFKIRTLSDDGAKPSRYLAETLSDETEPEPPRNLIRLGSGNKYLSTIT